MSIWMRPHDFDHLSWNGQAKCFACGSIKRDTESGVFRPPTFDDFSGFPDLCEGCIREAAAQLGLHDTAPIIGELETQTANAKLMHGQLTDAREVQAFLTRENVRLQDQLEEALKGTPLITLEEYLAEQEPGDDAA